MHHGSPPTGFGAPSITVRAAAVILREEFVLLHRRRSESVWALPGGRVEPGELASEAVVRELAEELGQRITVQRLAFLVENIFTHRGLRQHEVGFYFLAPLEPDSSLLAETQPFPGVEPGADLEF